MNPEPTQEQIKEFWEWCGFKHPTAKQAVWAIDPAKWWLWPGNPAYARPETPKLNLDNLFKYAVPEIRKRKLWVEFLRTGITEYMWVKDVDPALALFWAIYQVIKEGNHEPIYTGAN